MWRKLWFNVLALVLYSAAAFALSWMIVEPGNNAAFWIVGGSLAYGFGNVHFVLWFSFYTRWRKESQEGEGAGSRDELLM